MPRKDIPDFDFLLAPRIYLFILSGEIVSAPFSGMQVPSVWSLSIFHVFRGTRMNILLPFFLKQTSPGGYIFPATGQILDFLRLETCAARRITQKGFAGKPAKP